MTTVYGPRTMEQQPRKHLHQLIDDLPEQEIQAARRYLQFLCGQDDPVLRAIRSAPVDDEPLTDEDRAAIDEAQRDLDAGNRVSDAQIRADLGI